MFKTKSVDEILGVFTKTIKELEGAANSRASTVIDNNVKINSLQAENMAHEAEIEKANTAINKLNAIFN